MSSSAFNFTFSRLIKSSITRKFSIVPSASIFQKRNFSSTVDHLTKDQVQERVFNVLKAFEKVNSVTPFPNLASSFTNDLGLDSLDVVEVIMGVEEEFGIEIPDEAADNFKTPQEVIEFVHSKLQSI